MRSGRERGNLLSKLTALRAAAELLVRFAKAAPSSFSSHETQAVVTLLFIFTLIASTVYLTHFALTYEQPLTSGVTDVQEGAFFYSAQSDYKRSH